MVELTFHSTFIVSWYIFVGNSKNSTKTKTKENVNQNIPLFGASEIRFQLNVEMRCKFYRLIWYFVVILLIFFIYFVFVIWYVVVSLLFSSSFLSVLYALLYAACRFCFVCIFSLASWYILSVPYGVCVFTSLYFVEAMLYCGVNYRARLRPDHLMLSGSSYFAWTTTFNDDRRSRGE